VLRRNGKFSAYPDNQLTFIDDVQNGATTKLVHPGTTDERTFTFDYSFWSHDGFKEDGNGFFVPTSPKYAD